MTVPPFNQRFLASTRGRILALLRRSTRTVEELAEVLDLTDNAVRAHLATLERDGLVRQGELRRGARKPSFLYELTPQAQHIFPKAYEVTLRQILNELNVRMTTEQRDQFLWDVGRRLADGQRPNSGDVRERSAFAVTVMNNLGGLMELEEHEQEYSICGYSCPQGTLSQEHPEVCRIAQALLTELVGETVHERCERSESLACWFEIPKT